MSEEEGIRKKLEEQGLTLEVEIATILEERGWLVFQEFPYKDNDENKVRKSDIFAISSIKDKVLLLNIECKRSEKNPWVFYIKNDDIPFLSTIISEFDSIILNETHNIAVSYRIPFVGKDGFFEACNQVMKAIEATRDNPLISLPKGGEILSIPLIIFDGNLYQFSSYKKADLEKVDYIRYLNLDTKNSKVIRIIRKDYFTGFLDNHLTRDN